VRNDAIIFIVLFIAASIWTFFVLLVTRSFLPPSRNFQEFINRIFLLRYAEDIDKKLIDRHYKILMYCFVFPLVIYIFLGRKIFAN
jgi:hypothetical protein